MCVTGWKCEVSIAILCVQLCDVCAILQHRRRLRSCSIVLLCVHLLRRECPPGMLPSVAQLSPFGADFDSLAQAAGKIIKSADAAMWDNVKEHINTQSQRGGRPVVLVAGDIEEVTTVNLTVEYDFAWAVRKNSAAGYGSLWVTVVGEDGRDKHVLIGRETVQNCCAHCTCILAAEAARQREAVKEQATPARRCSGSERDLTAGLRKDAPRRRCAGRRRCAQTYCVLTCKCTYIRVLVLHMSGDSRWTPSRSTISEASQMACLRIQNACRRGGLRR